MYLLADIFAFPYGIGLELNGIDFNGIDEFALCQAVKGLFVPPFKYTLGKNYCKFSNICAQRSFLGNTLLLNYLWAFLS